MVEGRAKKTREGIEGDGNGGRGAGDDGAPRGGTRG